MSRSSSLAYGVARLRSPLFAGVVLLLAFAASSWWWLGNNGFLERPPSTEAAAYMLRGERFARILSEEGVRAWWGAWLTEESTHTALFPAAAGALAHALDRPLDARLGHAMTLASTGLGLLGAALLALRIGGHTAALWALALGVASPVIIAYARPFYPQMPMATLIVWAVLALHASEGFSRWRGSLAFGLLAGLAVSTKVIAPVHLLPAALWALLPSVPGASRRTRCLWASVAAGLGAALVLPWLFTNAERLKDYLRYANDPHASFSAGLQTSELTRWSYYLEHAVRTGIGGLNTLVLVVGSVWLGLYSWRNRTAAASRHGWPSASGKSLLTITLVASWLLLTVGQTAAGSQYLLPSVLLALPLLGGLAAALWSAGLGGRALGCALLFSLTLTAAAALRPMDEDLPRAHLCGLPLLDRADHWFTPLAASTGLHADGGGEEWPLERFAAALRRSFGVQRSLTVATCDPFLCAENLIRHLERLGGRGTPSAVLLKADGSIAAEGVDAFAWPERLFPYAQLSAMGPELLGAECEVLDRATVRGAGPYVLVRLNPLPQRNPAGESGDASTLSPAPPAGDPGSLRDDAR